MQTSIEFDGFEDFPGLRAELLSFVNSYCDQMTLAQAGEWFEDAFHRVPPGWS